MTLFAEDATVNVYIGNQLAMALNGKEAIAQGFSTFTQTVKASHHQNGQFLAEITGDTTAKATHYCTASLITEEDGTNYIQDNYIRYDDTFEKINGQWFIKTRTSHFISTTKRPL